MLRIIELFAGIGSQASALKRLGIEYQSVVCEIDDKAYRAYCAIHGPTENLGGITKVEHLPECDLITYSFPCQDLSIAGKQKGMEEGSGTRSALLWEVERLLNDMKDRNVLPEILLMENVDAILHKANKPHFDKFIVRLNELGYDSSYAILNAKDYGVPQNRRRCFMVSTLHKGHFAFPEGFPLEKRLKDVLEDNVDESFYLSEERIAKYERHRIRQEENGRGFGWKPLDPNKAEVPNTLSTTPIRHASGTFIDETSIVKAGDLNNSEFQAAKTVYGTEGVAPALTTTHPGIGLPKIEVVGDLNIQGNLEQHNRVYGTEGVAPALTTATGGGIVPRIEVVGEMTDVNFEQTARVYGTEGVAPSIKARDYKEPTKIEVVGDLNIQGNLEQHNRVYGTEGVSPTLFTPHGSDKSPKIEVKGHLGGRGKMTQHYTVYSKDGISPTLAACDYKDPVKIEEDNDD